jgi:adenylate cyclase
MMAMAECEMAQRGVPGTSMEQARAWAEQAIAADPSVAEGHAALADAILRVSAANFAGASPSVKAALDRDPDCYDAHVVNGYIHLAERDFAGAIVSLESAIAIEPQDYRARGMILQAYQGIGDIEGHKLAARRFVERGEAILKIEPDHGGAIGFLVTSYIALGEVDRAIDLARKAEIIDPDNMRLIYNLACAMAILGETDPALGLLGKMIERVDRGWLDWIDVDNDLDPIRDDPRFVTLIAKAKQG